MKRENKSSEKKLNIVREWQKNNPDKVKIHQERRKEKIKQEKELKKSEPYVFPPNRKVKIRIKESGSTAYFREYNRLYPEKIKAGRERRKQKVMEAKLSGITLGAYNPEYYEKRKDAFNKSQKKWISKDENMQRVLAYQRQYYRKTHPDVKKREPLTEEQQIERKKYISEYNRQRYIKHCLEKDPNYIVKNSTGIRYRERKKQLQTPEERKEKLRIYYQNNKEKIKQRYNERKNELQLN
jgi:hypothetical protein